LTILGGGYRPPQVDAAVADLLPASERVVVAARTHDEAVEHVAHSIQNRGRFVRVSTPPPSLAGAWRHARTSDWVGTDVSHRTGRLRRAVLPIEIAGASCLVAVTSISPADAPADPIVIGMWARFAHPRQRTGARLSNPRDGLTAEIALAVNPALVLVFATLDDMPILIATSDQLVAELSGLAIRQCMVRTSSDSIGPWEQPLVQHATELDLGVATPSEIRPGVRWLGGADDPNRERFRSLATDLVARIGVDFRG